MIVELRSVMRFCQSCLSLLLFFVSAACCGAQTAQSERQGVLFGKAGEVAGWPANPGLWSWGDEILVGFSIGSHQDLGSRHNINREQPEYHVLARSRDGGVNWEIEKPNDHGMLINAGGMRHGITDPSHQEDEPQKITESIRFDHPDFCMTMRFQNVDGGSSRLYYSYDRGRHWRGPFKVPTFNQRGVMARTDYLVNGKTDCQVFLTASKANDEEGRVFAGSTKDGGLTWKFDTYVGPEPHGFSIMPTTVRISDRHLVMATRRREGPGETKRRWIDCWQSLDNGMSWTALKDPVDDVGEGNPPSLIRMRDGRLCLTYGDRKPPFRMYAKLSEDAGQSWSDPLVLRDKIAGRDMGYPRTVQRADGKLVTIYYLYTPENRYRRVEATIWSPSSP